LFEQGLAFGVHLGEFDAHFLAGDAVADDGFGHDHAAGHFEDEGEVRAYAEGDGAVEGEASDAERLDARDLLLAATVPRYGHAFGQGNALVAAGDARCLAGHARSKSSFQIERKPIGQMYPWAERISGVGLVHDAEEIPVWIFEDDEIVCGSVSPGIAGGAGFYQALDFGVSVIRVKIEVQAAAFA